MRFDVPGTPSARANLAIQDKYGSGAQGYPELAVISLPPGSTMGSAIVRQGVADAFRALEADSHFRVASYANTGDPHFVSSDGRSTFGLIFVPEHSELEPSPFSAAIREALEPRLPQGSHLYVTGLADLITGGRSNVSSVGALTETALGGMGALLVLAFVFGSFLALLPLVIAVVSILSAFLIVLGLTEITSVSFIVEYLIALIGLGVAIDYSLLLVTRWREERAHGARGDEAVHRAMATAGRAITFSGATVAIGLFALVLVPVPFLRSVGFAGMLIPLVTVIVTLTLLPVVLATVGPRADWPRIRLDVSASRGWTAWARGVVRFRWLAAVAATTLLLALGIEALGMQLGEPQADALAGSGPATDGLRAFERAGFSLGALSPIEILVPANEEPTAVVARLSLVDGVSTVFAPSGPAWRRDETSIVDVLPADEGSTDAATRTLARVRYIVGLQFPGALAGGPSATLVDETLAFYGRFPVILPIIAIVTLVFLIRAFRSPLLAFKAVILNIVSVGATFGIVVIVWQHGLGSQLIWGIPATGSITNWGPLMTFAFLFGLSMDYEVFILSRIREERDRRSTTTGAIVEGIGRTGRLVTSAALILCLAFAALSASPETDLKIVATGLGAGILLDATLVRALLVPALMSLFGRWNWWMPAWLARLFRVPSESDVPDVKSANA